MIFMTNVMPYGKLLTADTYIELGIRIRSYYY